MYFEDSFFEAETKCGFEIPKLMKHTWAAELEVLKVVIDICNRHNLTYFADWGTLLGAVRHQGFIPWDDDIDICLKREDYMRLIPILQKQFPEGIYPVGPYTPRFLVTKVTTQTRAVAIRPAWDINDYIRFFHGYPFASVGIDIFPLDVVPRDKTAYEMQNKLIKMTQVIYSVWDKLKEEGGLKDSLARLEKRVGERFPWEASELEQKVYVRRMEDAMAALYGDADGDKLAEHTFAFNKPEYIMEKEWYSETVMLPFENIEIAAPCGYHEVLTAQFGDYMKPVRGAADHDYPFYKKDIEDCLNEYIKAGFTGELEEFCEMARKGQIVFGEGFREGE